MAIKHTLVQLSVRRICSGGGSDGMQINGQVSSQSLTHDGMASARRAARATTTAPGTGGLFGGGSD